jgi:hypothetical protein
VRIRGNNQAILFIADSEARQRNPQAFVPWTNEEEEEIQRRHVAGDSIQSIARARKRSPRAIELRVQQLGALRPTRPDSRRTSSGALDAVGTLRPTSDWVA